MDKDVREAKKVSASFKKNPRARVLYQKRMFGEEKVDTELEFLVCQTVLKDGYDFLRIFQSQDIKIHLLYEAFTSLLRDVLLDICEPEGLRTSKKAIGRL